MQDYFKDKVILITGSSMGIGKHLAHLLGADGAKLVINGRNPEVLKKTENELLQKGYKVKAFAGDIANQDNCKAMIDYTVEHYGKLDILVNNAAISMRSKIEAMLPKTIADMYKVNTIGPVTLSYYALPHIKKTKGSIVFVSSLAAFKGIPNISVYGSAKMAITGFAEALRVEQDGTGIHIGVVYVGYTEIQKGKTVLNEKGEPFELEPRSSYFVQSLETVAKKIRNHIYHRKKSTTIDLIGWVYRRLVRWFPRVMEFAVLNSYRRLKTIYK